MVFSTLILAAGAGTRMKSARAKTAHELLDKPMLRWVIDAARKAGSIETIAVVGHAREQLMPLVEDTTVIVQEEQLGTGHAVMATSHVLGHPDMPPSLVILCGDTPLITPDTIKSLVASQQDGGAALSLLTHMLDEPGAYGRIVRDESGNVVRIVEEKDALDWEKAIKECNSGAYCFDVEVLLESLGELETGNAQNEYYLTDVVGACARKGLAVKAYTVDAEEAQGINDRAQLAHATKVMQQRINAGHLMAGVTMLDPDLVWIGPDVAIENDVELLPNTMLYGATTVASGSVLGPNTRVTNSVIGHGCRVDESILIESRLEDDVCCGPRAYLRPGTVMMAASKAGTHVEIKNSCVGRGSKVPHLSYLGDATLGEDVNIGAGTITCNYDGQVKSPTTIGDRAFVGSDTMLVAPVTLGADIVIGAGSVITKDVPSGALALERTDQTIIDGWVQKHRKQKHSKQEHSKQEHGKEKSK